MLVVILLRGIVLVLQLILLQIQAKHDLPKGFWSAMTRQSCERNLQINKINTDFLKYIKTIKISMCNVQNFFQT